MVKPNIILIHTDSWDGRLLGCHPFRGVRTPHADRLAAQGTCFTNAYSPSPLCTPARACLWSGRLPHRTGAWNFHRGLAPGMGTFENHLVESDYVVRMIGRRDFRDRPARLGTTFWITCWLRASPLGVPRLHDPMADDFLRIADGDTPRCDVTKDWRWSDEAIATIQQFGRSARAQPFFLSVGLLRPHASHPPNRYWFERIDPHALRLPSRTYPSHPVIDFVRRNRGCEQPFPEARLRLYMQRYFAKVAEADAVLGRMLDAVDAAGLADSTYIIFTSDHGDMNGDHNLFAKTLFYEGSARVPLLIRGPGIAADRTVDAPTSLLDIHPTILDMSGPPEIDPDVDGHSLLPECTGGAVSRPPRALGLYAANDQPCNAYMLREGAWKYIAYPGYAPQLFNLRDDPDELTDLAPSRADLCSAMDRRLRAHVPCDQVDRDVLAYEKQAVREWMTAQGSASAHAELRALCGTFGSAEAAELSAWLDAP